MKCLKFDILVCITALFLSSKARNWSVNKEGKTFSMEEYRYVDEDLYPYEDITEEDIWEYHIAEDAGVIKLTEKLYNERILNMKPGDKPWLISIVYPANTGGQKDIWWHSTHVMKSLYFLQTDHSDLAYYAYINTHDELLREAFENDGIP